MSVIVYAGDYIKVTGVPVYRKVVDVREIADIECVVLEDDSVYAISDLAIDDVLLESEVNK